MNVPLAACWRAEDARSIFVTEALEGDDAIFLATHTPIEGFDVAGPFKERTACHVWNALRNLPNLRVFLWNTVFLQTHEEGNEMSIRRHNEHERELCKPLLSRLIQIVKPRVAVGIGRDAFEALVHVDVPRVFVPHPSNGRQNAFRDKILGVHDELLSQS